MVISYIIISFRSDISLKKFNILLKKVYFKSVLWGVFKEKIYPYVLRLRDCRSKSSESLVSSCRSDEDVSTFERGEKWIFALYHFGMTS